MITHPFSTPKLHIRRKPSSPARKPFFRLIRFLLAVFLFLPSLAACTGAPPATITPTPLPQDTITPTSISTPTPTEVVIPEFEPGQLNPQDIPDLNAIVDGALVRPASQGDR